MNAIWIILALTSGAVLGLFFFGGLWMTVRRAAPKQQPLFFLLSFLARTAVVSVGFYWVGGGRWERLAACLVGFLFARMILVHCLGGQAFRMEGDRDAERVVG